MQSRRRSTVGFSVVLLTLPWAVAHCGSSEQDVQNAGDAPQALRPEMLDPTLSLEPSPLDWFKSTDEELAAVLADHFPKAKVLSDDHPLTRRLQFWTDAIYMGLKEKHAVRWGSLRENQAIPRPRLRLVDHPEPNAFSYGAYHCVESPIRFAEAPADAVPADDSFLVWSGGALLPAPSQLACRGALKARSAKAAEVAGYMRNVWRVPNCTVTVEEDTVVLGKGCPVLGTGLSNVGGIVVPSTSDQVVVTTGLVEGLGSEEAVVGTLGHELGHYFLSHARVSSTGADYFYRQSVENLALDRPKPDPTLDRLGEVLIRVGDFWLQPVAGQALHSKIFTLLPRLVSDVVKPACASPDARCHDSCARLVAMGSSATVLEDFGGFPLRSPTGPYLERYWDYEREMKACLEQVAIVESTSRGSATTGASAGDASATPDSGADANANSPVADGGATSSNSQALPSGPENVSKLYRLLGPFDTRSLGNGESVYSLVQRVSEELTKEDQPLRAILQKAVDEKLGYYTTEQEADHMALQVVAMLGIDPRSFEAMLLRLAQLEEGTQQESLYNLGYRRCKALYEAVPRWTENGRPVEVPIGIFSDPHHSTCYRLYNVDKVLGIKSYPMGPSRMEQASRVGGAWANLVRQSLSELSKKDPAEASPTEGTAAPRP